MVSKILITLSVATACVMTTSTLADWSPGVPLSQAPAHPSLTPSRSAARPLPPVPGSSNVQSSQSINPRTEDFFKQLNTDLSSAFKIIQSLFGTITISKKDFYQEGVLSEAKRRTPKFLKKDSKTKFNSFEEYQLIMAQSYDSFLFVDFKSLFTELSTHGFKSSTGMVVYNSQIKGLMVRAIRLGAQIAPKIPALALPSNQALGIDMYGAYLKVLSEGSLKTLRSSLEGAVFTTDELNKFKKEFLDAVVKEQLARTSNTKRKK